MTLASPNDFVESYIAIMSVIATKCVSVDSSQTDLHAACTSVKRSIVNLKKFVEPLNAILPNEGDLLTLSTLEAPKQGQDWQVEVREGASMLLGLEKDHRHRFPEDEVLTSIFSPLRMAELKKVSLKGSNISSGMQAQHDLELGFNNLAQVRGLRFQMIEYFSTLKWVLAATLFPQLTLLLALSINFIINRRKQNKLRKQIKKAEENRVLMGRMRNWAANRDPDRFVEI